MTWLLRAGEIAAAISAVIGMVVLVRGKIVRPLIGAWQELLTLLGQIKDASAGVQRLAREVESLAGAVTQFVVGIKEQLDEHTGRLARLEEMHDMVIDLQADIERHMRDPEGHQ